MVAILRSWWVRQSNIEAEALYIQRACYNSVDNGHGVAVEYAMKLM